MSKLTLVVLAAGLGSRYGGLKQMNGFGPSNETLLEYGVYDAIQAWFEKVVFIIRESFAQEFKDRIWSKLSKKIEVTYVCQEIDAQVPEQFVWLIPDRQKPRGTAHAVLVARDVVTTPFAVINADDFYGRAAYLQIATFLHTSAPEDMWLVGYVLKNTISPYGAVNRGVCSVDAGKLVSVHEHLKINSQEGDFVDQEGIVVAPDTIVSMNFRWFHPSFFQAIEDWFIKFLSLYALQKKGEYFIPLTVDTYLQQHKWTCEVMMSHDIRCGVTYPEDNPFVQQHIGSLVKQWVYPEKLWD